MLQPRRKSVRKIHCIESLESIMENDVKVITYSRVFEDNHENYNVDVEYFNATGVPGGYVVTMNLYQGDLDIIDCIIAQGLFEHTAKQAAIVCINNCDSVRDCFVYEKK